VGRPRPILVKLSGETEEHTVCWSGGGESVLFRAGRRARSSGVSSTNPTGRRIGDHLPGFVPSPEVLRCVEPVNWKRSPARVHHGGIVAVIEPRFLRRPRPGGRAPLGALRRNLCCCSIGLATCTTLGPSSARRPFSALSTSYFQTIRISAAGRTRAYRVAEGAMEHVEIHAVTSLAEFGSRAKALLSGHRNGGPRRRAHPPVSGARSLPGNSPERPVALVLGTSSAVSPPRWRQRAKQLVRILRERCRSIAQRLGGRGGPLLGVFGRLSIGPSRRTPPQVIPTEKTIRPARLYSVVMGLPQPAIRRQMKNPLTTIIRIR